jgi:cytochrome c556
MPLIVKTFAAAALFVASTSVAQAQLKPEELLKLRQGVMVIQKAQVGPMSAVAKGEAPLSDATAQQAATLATVSRLIPVGFAPESQSAPGPTRAKPEIWKSFDEFKKKAEALATESAKLADVAKKKDLAAFKAQFAATTAACKACHDTFRAE